MQVCIAKAFLLEVAKKVVEDCIFKSCIRKQIVGNALLNEFENFIMFARCNISFRMFTRCSISFRMSTRCSISFNFSNET